MNVKELIELLSAFDPERQVSVSISSDDGAELDVLRVYSSESIHLSPTAVLIDVG